MRKKLISLLQMKFEDERCYIQYECSTRYFIELAARHLGKVDWEIKDAMFELYKEGVIDCIFCPKTLESYYQYTPKKKANKRTWK